jgi:DNA-binding response OmpR family regulator
MGGNGLSVLVVDDDASLRTLSRVLLELEGFSVTEAGSVEEAEAAIAAARPAVVLLDVHLGAAASDELFARLRREGIPVAAVTGTADVAGYSDRADATLVKPFEPSALVDLARRLAGRVAQQ